MADRYISEKALIENIAKIEDLRTLSTKTIGEAISNTPTADVVEVRHGEWDYYSTTMMECSVCKRHTPRHRYEFCPHCGAKMGGKTE